LKAGTDVPIRICNAGGGGGHFMMIKRRARRRRQQEVPDQRPWTGKTLG